MVSDAMRKKWGTIFMGDKEATMEQLDAMQEPALRERAQKDQEKEYLERVRKRACDRAREILGEAYTERQKILDEAHKEIQNLQATLLKDSEAIKADAQKIRFDAQAELERAKQVSLEAEQIKSQAYNEGYEKGMEQAGQELREFRADLGHEMAQVLRSIGSQLGAITNCWRDDLAELVRQAVSTATGWVLDHNHETILKNLVLQAVNLLEEREVVTVRVNSEDEAIVSDLFRAAREKAPELKQWIVHGDDSIERGGLVAESGSGSVDLQRQNYRNLVTEILEHLSLPQREAEKVAEQDFQREVSQTAMSLEAQALAAVKKPEKEIEPPNSELASPTLNRDEATPNINAAKQAPKQGEQVDNGTNNCEVTQQVAGNQAQELQTQPLTEEIAQGQNFDQSDPANANPQAAELLGTNVEDDAENLGSELPADELASTAQAENKDKTNADPSLKDLEEELFPVGQDEESNVLANGGFLPENNPN